MASLPNKSPRRRSLNTAADWPSTPEIDGFTWELGPDPSDADAAWAAANLGGDFHADEMTPDDVIDRQAEEAMALDLLERGIRPF